MSGRSISDTEKFVAKEPCPKCNTPLKHARGIGPYCPNMGCDMIDGTGVDVHPEEEIHVHLKDKPTLEERVDKIEQEVERLIVYARTGGAYYDGR